MFLMCLIIRRAIVMFSELRYKFMQSSHWYQIELNCQLRAPVLLFPEKDTLVPTAQEAGWVLTWSELGEEINLWPEMNRTLKIGSRLTMTQHDPTMTLQKNVVTVNIK